MTITKESIAAVIGNAKTEKQIIKAIEKAGIHPDYYENKPYRYPFFGSALYLTPSGNIGYEHFGSSAIKATLRDLEWLITVIFKTTPSGFLRDYIRNDQSAIA